MLPMQELEFKILGTLLLSGQQHRDRIFREVQPSFFEEQTLGNIYRKLSEAYRRHPNADSAVLLNALSKDEATNVLLAMDRMISPSIAAEQLEDTLSAFRDAYFNRSLKNSIIDLAAGDPTADDVRRLAETTEKFTRTRIDSAAAYLETYSMPIEAVGTGFIELDKLLSGGFVKGTLTTIGARPSTGKTTFAINIAVHNPALKVLFISIEMSSRMIFDRIVADKANVPYAKCGLHLVDYDVVKNVIDQFPNLMIADDISDVEDIETLIYQTHPDVIIIDYIQIVTSYRRFTDNRQRIDYISRRLKSTAKKTKSCIISLSQITRGGKDRPTMSDLKESGGLEQDSDYIILLYREYVNCKESHVSAKATTVTLDKNKFGRTGEIEMDFDGNHQRFTVAEDLITRPNVAGGNDLPF